MYLCRVETFKRRLHIIVFGTDTRAGRNFDIALLIAIFLSVLTILLESIPSYKLRYGAELYYIEWFFTILFSLEYLLRVWISPRPFRYILSVWGLVDLLSILPTYLLGLTYNYQSLRILRAMRLIRIFRIFKLYRFTSESQALYHALKASYYRIMVFLLFVLLLTVISGTIMYLVEDGQNGFESIPASIYWAIVTITTVGFGDITPTTGLGQFLASAMMILGYAIIAMPTGLITMEMTKFKGDTKRHACAECNHINPPGSHFCNQCGHELFHN